MFQFPGQGKPAQGILFDCDFGSTADTWLRMQMQWDLWQARQRADTITVKKRFADPEPLPC